MNTVLISPIVKVQEKPWSQLQGEPDKEFSQFVIFKNLGVGRTIKDARNIAEPHKKEQNGTSTWRKLSQKWSWFQRAEAWDADIARQSTEKIEAQRIEETVTLGMKTEKALHRMMDIINECLEAKDVEALKKYAPILITMAGKGGAAPFMIQIYRSIFGGKDKGEKSDIAGMTYTFEIGGDDK